MNAYDVKPRTILGMAIMGTLVVAALFAPIIAPSDSHWYPLTVNLAASNMPPFSPGHILGTDHLGRDLFSEAIWASRASLAVGILAAGLAMSLGALWGSFSALAGGIIDSLMMRVVDGFLAIPNMILALALGSFISTPALAQSLPAPVLSFLQVSNYSQGLLPLLTVVFVVSATSWLEAARLSRARVMTIKTGEYITAAVALGVGTGGMLSRHLLPNAAPILIVEATLLVSEAVLMEAGLSFLGLGLGPSVPSWGGMLSSAQTSLLQNNWWAAAVPGLLITATVFAVNMIGEGWLQDKTNGRHHRAAARPAP
jgi:peptide/nickel transport system permease protein